MTFSIVASNSNTGELCVATATCFVAVGCRVPKIIPKVGAIAVQASPNPSNRRDILLLMQKGKSNEQAISEVLKNDKKKEERQIFVINTKGESSVFSGKKTISITDSFVGENFAIAGNMLASHNVISSMVNTFKDNPKCSLPKRMLYALQAGEKEGGDKRGKMSAAILYSKPNLRIMNLRIDYSHDPLKDLSIALELRCSKKYKNLFNY